MEKSVWEPSNIMEWICFLINLTKGEFAVPERKMQALMSKLLEVKSIRHVQARHLASVNGKISFMSLGLGPVCRLMTWSLYATLNGRQS